MADFSPEDLSREIDRLWSRVGSLPSEPSSAASVHATPTTGAYAGAEVAWETVGLLKRQQRQRESTWEAAIQARDEATRVLRARLDAAESELARHRQRAEGEDERLLVEALDARQKVETAAKALELAESRHAEERAALEGMMQNLRERLAAESARGRGAEQRWQSREQQYLLDLKELQALAARRETENAESGRAVRALETSLAEAKNALEKTLSELLLERKERERAHGEREAALKKVEELRAHVDELSKIWDEERAQWRELWDRERSTWETQRTELAHWEENLRREREAWHAELAAKEKAHLTLTEDLTARVRESSLTAERMTGMMDGFERRAAEESDRAPRDARAAAEKRRRWTLALACAAAVSAAAVPAWRAAASWRFVVESVSPAPTVNPSAMAVDGGLIWIADWSGRIVAVDAADARRVVRSANPAPGGPYRPTAVAAGGGSLWTLDAAQARLLRHSASAPNKIVSARPSPGPAPTALAFDGETVWSYDAVDRAVTRHAGDDAPAQSYSLPDDAVPNSMAWSGGRLWIHDAKARRVLIYAVEAGKLVRVDAQPMPEPGALGLAAAGTAAKPEVVALFAPSGARAQAALIRYRIRRVLPFARF